jgi:DNA-binding HxlR family transcriptional regulator
MRGEEGTLAKPGHLRETALKGDLFDPTCPTRGLLDRMGSKWTVMIVLLLSDQSELRFSELRRAMSGVSQKMLSQTLRQLGRDGLVNRRVDPDITPPAVHYALTPLGRSLVPPLAALRTWAEEHMREVDDHNARTTSP